MILVLRALGLGDLLTAVPALRALRRGIGEHLVLAAPAPLAPLVHRLGAAGALLPVPSAVRHPPGPIVGVPRRPRLAVNLHGVGPQSTDVLRDTRPDELWAYGEPGAPAWRAGDHEVDRWCRLVAGYGIQADRTDLFLAEQPSARDGPVLVHPGAADPRRRWPADRFAAVARALATHGWPVRVSAGPGERALAAEVCARAGLPAATVVTGLDLDQLTDLVLSSPLVLCGDTGVAHLATAGRTPSVLLFGPQPPSRWGPPAHAHHRVFWRDRPDGGVHMVHPALLEITSDEVIDAAFEQLARGYSPRLTSPL